MLIDRAEGKLAQLCTELGPNALPLVVDLLERTQVSAMLGQVLALAGDLGLR